MGRAGLHVLLLCCLGACTREDSAVPAPAPSSRAAHTAPQTVPSPASPRAAPPWAASPSAAPSKGAPPDYRLPVPSLGSDAAATRYAAMSARACGAEAARRKLPLIAARRPYKGVVSPVRVTGAMNGVALDVPGPRSPFGILDCRLALAIDDMTRELQRLGVTAIRVDNLYRKGAKVSGKGSPSQHAAGLALDILALTSQGAEISVEESWSGRLGTQPCGPHSVLQDASPASLQLRNAVCEIARHGLFHHMLTPSRNRAHADHLHFDIEAGEDSLLLE